MAYSMDDFRSGIIRQMETGYDVLKISRWAHSEYLEHCLATISELQHIMMHIIAMEEGPEFEMSEADLRFLVGEHE